MLLKYGMVLYAQQLCEEIVTSQILDEDDDYSTKYAKNSKIS